MPWKKDSKVVQRLRLVQAMIRQDANVAQLCGASGISRQTAYKFLRRYEAEGRSGLVDRSRANTGQPRLVVWRRRVLALRRCWPTWGAAKLRQRLRKRWPRQRWPSQRTMARWLAAAGYVRGRKPVRKGRALPVNGARACRCNQIWTADLKGLLCTL